MKYENWYKDITDRAKNRVIDEYTETHHIIPKSMGGDDSQDNLVKLTPREHFICHWLLVKITAGEDHWKMLNALRMMRAENSKQTRYKTKITARVYANLKQEYAEVQSERLKGEGNGFFGKNHTEEAKERIRQKNLGNKLTPEQLARLKANTKGKKKPPITDAHRENLSKNHKSKNPDYDCSHSDETKDKIREKAIGRKQSEETIKKKADAVRGSKREKKHCDWCNEDVAVNGYARFHGDNCHMNPSSPRYNPAKKRR